MMADARFLIQFRKDCVPVFQFQDIEESQVSSVFAEYIDKSGAWHTDINLIGPTLKRLGLGQLHFIATTLTTDICITKTYEDNATVLKVADRRVPLLPDSDDESDASQVDIANNSDDEDKPANTYLECKVFCIRNTNNVLIWLILKARDLLDYIAQSDYVKLNQAQPNTRR